MSRLDELLVRLHTAQSVEQIHDACSRFCEIYGFDHFIYGVRLPTSLHNPQIVIINGYPSAWRAHYGARGYLAIDPTIVHCDARSTPLAWTALGKSALPQATVTERFMAEAHDFGLRDGVSFPGRGGSGEASIFSVASEQEHSAALASRHMADTLAAGHLINAYLMESVTRLFVAREVPVGRVQLTARERECLLWAAEGKTTWATARILGISERTVLFHLRNAGTKLNVSNRAQAVARALSWNLLSGPHEGSHTT